MEKEMHLSEIFAVVQFGGTTKEQYFHTFADRGSAARYIKSASRASYSCLGPFSLSVRQASGLIASARKTVRWLKKLRMGGEPQILELESALAKATLKEL